MKKGIILNAVIITLLLNASPAFAQSADVAKIETFIKSIINIMTTLAGLIATGFLVWGGIRYTTSTGSPDALESAKKTCIYSGVGLVIVLGAFMLSNIITELATTAFGH